MTRRRPLARALAAALLVAAAGCAQAGFGPAPVVQDQAFHVPTGSLAKIAVMPFYPSPELSRGLGTKSPLSGADAADTIAAFLTEALKVRGFDVVAPNDLLSAFVASGHPVPRLDPREAGVVAAREFSATAVMLGKVYRYRDRQGDSYGASQPASVGYEVSLFDAKSGKRLWQSRFDETQQPLSANVFNAQRYPGGGTRWLTAGELARWGADGTAQALAAYK